MTRISAKELVDDFFDEKFNGKVRDRSQESRIRESPNKRAYNEDSLVFETKIVDREGVEVTVGALGMLSEEANKLSWKHFKNYMIRNGGIEKNFPRKSEVKVFYIDEEDDEIFVDTDDEYKELLKIASQKNKDGNTMVLKFISVTKTRRHYGDRKVDLLGREVKTSPGKVTKPNSSKHFDSVSGRIWKLNSGKNMRGKMPGKMVPLLGPMPAKPITVTVGLNEIKDLSNSFEESRISDMAACSPRSAQSPVSHEILKQQASVFDWISKNGPKEKDMPPPWFAEYMENYKDELTAEITAKVVHSLGIVIENKLAGFETKKTSDAKVQTKAFDNKVKKPRDTKKVKKEAMRMTMEINEEPESKEIKKLKKSLIKKTDKVVKVAMKIEKKHQQEEKTRKTSLSSSSSSEMGIKLPTKKEKKESKKFKKSKSKKNKENVLVKADDTSEEETQYPVTLVQTYPISPVKSYPVTPVKNYPVTPVKDYPLVKSPTPFVSKDDVVTKQPTSTNKNSKDDVLKPKTKKKLTVIDQLFARQMNGNFDPIEIKKGDGKLANAVYLSEDNRLVQQVKPEAKIQSDVKIINMGCLDWTEKVTVQKTISSEGLFCPESFVKLPGLKPGEEGMIRFNFTAPSKTGLHESIWHFFDGKDRFGPAIKFKFLVKSESQAIPLKGVEMKDFGKNPEVEMKGIGISAKSQEMVEMSSNRLADKILSSSSNKEIITITDSNHNSFEEAKDSVEDDFDLLASEVNTLTIETITSDDEKEDDDDFEVIPVPACFNLDVPFEIVEDDQSCSTSSDEEESSTSTKTFDSDEVVIGKLPIQTSLEEAKAAVNLVRDKLERSSSTQLKIDTAPTASVERLVELGFANRDENKKLLKQNDNNLEKVLEKLYSDRGSKWAEKRH
eukprot:TRINITY_DN2213_c0_g1_i1.p1 TRINITY_DN2213_c0_g1~~TRINITY_DN2213_c0_g1_i1.p1  ORF type:complete len:895 (-),score=298.45 TRINITY_DN2213_c0_g1_i1:482-3166(-)